MELDKQDPATSFSEESPNTIWNHVDDSEEDDTPAFLRRRKKHKKTDES